jgi:hypothetical protein
MSFTPGTEIQMMLPFLRLPYTLVLDWHQTRSPCSVQDFPLAFDTVTHVELYNTWFKATKNCLGAPGISMSEEHTVYPRSYEVQNC